MLTPRKSSWFEWLFGHYNRNLIGRRFAGLRVAGWENLTQRPMDAPLLLYANHSSWWDALIIVHLNRRARLDGYALMEERQLVQYQFFRRLGAVGVVREDARAARESLLYLANLLGGTARALWIFPQGVTQPNDVRPLQLYNGAARVVQKLGCTYAAPVALRYEFLQDFKPMAFARIGLPQLCTALDGASVKRLTQTFTDNLTATLDRVRQDIVAEQLSEYQEI